jgi:hypothetical protein
MTETQHLHIVIRRLYWDKRFLAMRVSKLPTVCARLMLKSGLDVHYDGPPETVAAQLCAVLGDDA